MGLAPWARTESVDGWPMAITIRKRLGGPPKPVAVSGRDGRLVSSFWGVYVAEWAGVPRRESPRTAYGPPPGQLSGGNWKAVDVPLAPASGVSWAGRIGFGRAPNLLTHPDPLLGGFPGPSSFRAAACPVKIVTSWLILPVVICLSQRLSHACLSISNLYGETANGLTFMGRSEHVAGFALRPCQNVGL